MRLKRGTSSRYDLQAGLLCQRDAFDRAAAVFLLLVASEAERDVRSIGLFHPRLHLLHHRRRHTASISRVLGWLHRHELRQP